MSTTKLSFDSCIAHTSAETTGWVSPAGGSSQFCFCMMDVFLDSRVSGLPMKSKADKASLDMSIDSSSAIRCSHNVHSNNENI